jgi:hypothetical protein
MQELVTADASKSHAQFVRVAPGFLASTRSAGASTVSGRDPSRIMHPLQADADGLRPLIATEKATGASLN